MRTNDCEKVNDKRKHKLEINDGHLGHVTWIIYIYIGFHFLKMLHVKFDFDCFSEDL